MKKEIIIKKTTSVEIPSVPNFIKCGEQVVSLADFTEGELRQIGREWISKLLARAQEVRNKKSPLSS